MHCNPHVSRFLFRTSQTLAKENSGQLFDGNWYILVLHQWYIQGLNCDQRNTNLAKHRQQNQWECSKHGEGGGNGVFWFFGEIGCFWYLRVLLVKEYSKWVPASHFFWGRGRFFGGYLAHGVGGDYFCWYNVEWYLIDCVFFFGGVADFGVTAQLLWIYVMSTHNLANKNPPHEWCELAKFLTFPPDSHLLPPNQMWPKFELKMGFEKCHAFSTYSKMLIHWHCVFQFLEHWPDSKKNIQTEKHSVLTSYSPLFSETSLGSPPKHHYLRRLPSPIRLTCNLKTWPALVKASNASNSPRETRIFETCFFCFRTCIFVVPSL